MGSNWTKAPPTEPGWYWWRNRLGQGYVFEVVDWPGGGLAVMGQYREYITPAQRGGEWSGPLQEPGGDAEEVEHGNPSNPG